MSTVLCTFNANNLFARYRFGETFPGDRSRKSEVAPPWGYLPMYDPDLIELFNEDQRKLSAQALRGYNGTYPDILCLQEIESLWGLRTFNEQYLSNEYRHAVLIDSRDFRQIDVAVLSKKDILSVRSHVDEVIESHVGTDQPWLFSRDCLEVSVGVGAGRSLTLFVNHLKSKYAESAQDRQRADERRERQARRVRSIVQERFGGHAFDEEWFAVVGDLNDEPESPPVRCLVKESGLFDAFSRMGHPTDRWTHWYSSENVVSQLDHLLLSPALASATDGMTPHIERRGIGFARILVDGSPGPRFAHYHSRDSDPNPVDVGFQFDRFEDVTPKQKASDHCPVFLEIP